MQEGRTHAGQHTPLPVPVVTPPPGGWPNPNGGGSYLPPTGQAWADPVTLDKLKREVEQLKGHNASMSEENKSLKAEISTLKLSSGDMEATLMGAQSKQALSSSPSSSNQTE